MRKHLLLLVCLLAIAGVSLAQDVYSAGYYTNQNGKNEAVLFKNQERIHVWGEGTDNYDYNSTSVLVDPYTGDVYCTKNVKNSNGEPMYGDIMKGSDYFMNTPSSSRNYINQLYWHKTPTDSNPNARIFSAGYRLGSDNKRYATVWRGGDATPMFSPDFESGNESQAYDVCVFLNSEYDISVLYCGYVYEGYTRHATVWKDDALCYTLSTNYSYAVSMDYYDGSVYTLVNETDPSVNETVINVYKNATLLYALTDVSETANGYQIKVDGGDVYVCGYGVSRAQYVWKNGQPYYAMGYGGYCPSLDVTTEGVYAAHVSYDEATIYRDGTALYSLDREKCSYVSDIAVPEFCELDAIGTLPFYEGFEMGNTQWICWTTEDEIGGYGGNLNFNTTGTEEYASYFHRYGSNPDASYNHILPASGDYCVKHRFNGSYDQEGWLIWPQKFFLQNGRTTLLTFKTMEEYANDYQYEGVYISTSGTNLSDFNEVWTQSAPSMSWKTVTIDLADYQGRYVYIAFKYKGNNAHNWYIDDISLTEEYEFCEAIQDYPFVDNFDDQDAHCYYLVDMDQSGSNHNWFISDETAFNGDYCLTHTWGPQNSPQEDWCITRPFDLPAGQVYTLSFMNKNYETGANMSNSVWVAVDKSNPQPSDFVQVWNQAGTFPTTWTPVSINLTEYAGHKIHVAFKYTGTWAHCWYIDALTLTQAAPQYVITVNSNNVNWGTVTGGGEFTEGTTVTIHATPNTGYDFLKWTKDGLEVSTSQDYTFTVTENATYTAVFGEHAVEYYSITTGVTPMESGSVQGGGTYAAGTSVFLLAQPNTGWYFVNWTDGVTDNPREITVNGDATYVARFARLEYTIEVVANPEEGGTVTGGGTYQYGEEAHLSATPNEGYEFFAWDDGLTLPNRVVTVTQNATYTATFTTSAAPMFTITAEPNDPNLGIVTGGGTYPEGAVVTLTATPIDNAVFTRWNDGVEEPVRTITVTQDATYTAYFESVQEYTITVVSNNPEMGMVTGGGTFMAGTVITIEAIPNAGFYFSGWDDNNFDNPRTITVTGNATYRAGFSAQQVEYYTLNVICNPNEGTVIGGGDYAPGTSVMVAAIPAQGFQFTSWNDGVTDNPRNVVVNSNITLVAFFFPTSVDENNAVALGVYPNPTRNTVVFTGIDDHTQVSIYNALGALVKTVTTSANEEVNINDLSSGLYFARVNNSYVKFVVY